MNVILKCVSLVDISSPYLLSFLVIACFAGVFFPILRGVQVTGNQVPKSEVGPDENSSPRDYVHPFQHHHLPTLTST